ncbi:MAG: DUF697 domain-containing protein [Pseudomonadota bacterium]
MTAAASVEIPESSVVYDTEAQAGMVVKDYVVYSMGTAFIPVPIVDFVGLIGLQVKMVHSLSKIYGVPFSEKRTRSILYSLLGSIIPVAGVGLLASAVKLVPFIGQVAGSVSMATLAGGSTYAVGRIFVKHFEKNGNLDDLDVDSAKNDMKNNISAAKAKASNIKKEA